MTVWYRIEEGHDGVFYPNHRFVSLVNGARGTWTTKKEAIEEGETHKELLCLLHGVT